MTCEFVSVEESEESTEMHWRKDEREGTSQNARIVLNEKNVLHSHWRSECARQRAILAIT